MHEIQDMLAHLEWQQGMLVAALKRKHVSKSGLCSRESLPHNREHKHRQQLRQWAHLKWAVPVLA